MILADLSFSLDTVVIGVFAVLIGPTALVYANARSLRHSKEQDWARQDEVADKQARANAELLATNRRIAAATESNSADIAVIKRNGETAVHLADGAYTALLRAQLASVQAKLNSDELLAAYRQGTDRPPSDEELRMITKGHTDIRALEAEIATREHVVANLGIPVIDPSNKENPQ